MSVVSSELFDRRDVFEALAGCKHCLKVRTLTIFPLVRSQQKGARLPTSPRTSCVLGLSGAFVFY